MTVPARRVSLTIGDSENAIIIEGLRIDFEIVKYYGSAPDLATIKVYNLRQDRRALLRDRYRRAVLSFGYNDFLSTLFAGQVYNVVDSREQGTDVVTTLYCGAGVQVSEQGILQRVFPNGTSYGEMMTAVTEVVEQFGIEVETITQTVTALGVDAERGRTLSGSVTDVLDTLVENTGLTYTINDEVLRIEELTLDENPSLVITPATGLIGSVQRTNQGYDFTSLLNPRIKPGRTLGVFSEFSSTVRDGLQFASYANGVGGRINPIRVDHAGSNFGGAATTKVVGQA